MADNKFNAPSTEPTHGKLLGVQFMPGVVVSLSGKHTAMTYWRRDTMLDGQQPQDQVRIEELKNGDLRVLTADGKVREVCAWAVAWRMYEPEGKR